MEAIKTVGLTKKYKNLTAVDGLDLSVERGELFSLLGVNGAGKTTTIKMLSCLTKPTGGDAFLLGRSIARDAAEVKNIIGVSPQETAVAPGLTVKENLTLIIWSDNLQKISLVAAPEQAGTSLGIFDELELRRLDLQGVHILLGVDLSGVEQELMRGDAEQGLCELSDRGD